MKRSELRQIIREEVKQLTSAMRIREARNEFQVTDFPEGTKILFKDGEEWIVVKPGMRGSSNRRKSDEITIRPFNKLAKDRNVSLPIDIDLDSLNANTKSISESSEGRSQIKRKQLPAMLPESIGPEAAVIHSMTRAGQDAVMNFINDHDLSAAKIIDYLKRNPDQRYNVRDLIAGAGVGAQRLYRDKMLKLFR